MKIGQAVKEHILQLCSERKITVNRLAILSGLTQSTLNNIISGRNNSVTAATIQKICDGLGITHREFYNDPLFDYIEQELR